MPTKMHANSLEEQAQIFHAKLEWEQTFDAVSDLIFIVDNDFNFIRANRAMAEHCGLTPMELVGRKCFEVIHGTECAPDNCLMPSIFECKKPLKAEYCVDKLNGTYEVTMSPFFSDDGEITATVHVARDVTEKNVMRSCWRRSKNSLKR